MIDPILFALLISLLITLVVAHKVFNVTERVAEKSGFDDPLIGTGSLREDVQSCSFLQYFLI